MQENIEEANRWWEAEPLASGGGETTSIRVDLEDRDEILVLSAELPGFDKDDIDVRVTDRTLRLEAEKEKQGEFIGRDAQNGARDQRHKNRGELSGARLGITVTS